MYKIFLFLGSSMAALAVGIGAFGAHALKAILEQTARTETFETGVKYHMYHALAIILVGLVLQRATESSIVVWAGWLFFIGILIFSGSLYILGITNIKWLGAITPIGGVCFLVGWGLLAWAGLKD